VTDVLGYVSQCELCGQRAITLAPHGADWTCPRCAEVTEPSPYASGGIIENPGDSTPAFLDSGCTYRIPNSAATRLPGGEDEDDGYDLRKIQG